MLNIGGLNEGIVLDHIHAGGAMEIYNYLNLEKLDCSVAIIKNAPKTNITIHIMAKEDAVDFLFFIIFLNS